MSAVAFGRGALRRDRRQKKAPGEVAREVAAGLSLPLRSSQNVLSREWCPGDIYHALAQVARLGGDRDAAAHWRWRRDTAKARTSLQRKIVRIRNEAELQ